MQFSEIGRVLGDAPTMVFLPGTACTWQVNFGGVLDALSERYHLACVNYDGFEGDPTICFTSIEEVTAKIEDYLIETHAVHVEGVYGSSLGGSIAALMVERGRVSIEHCIIGSSDLDQGSAIVAYLKAAIAVPLLKGMLKGERSRRRMARRLARRLGVDEGDESVRAFVEGLAAGVAAQHPKTLVREFCSDYVTPLSDGIGHKETTIHVIHALKMDPKGIYLARYLSHFAAPDIWDFDMGHEEWLLGGASTERVLAAIDSLMGIA